MKVAVVGAGAIGCHLAARTQRGGADTTLIARGANLTEIAAGGLHVAGRDWEISAQVKVTDDPASVPEQDLVIVAVKAPALPSAVDVIVPMLGAATDIVFVTNGIPWWYFHGVKGPLEGTRLPKLDSDGKLWSLGPDRVIGGVIYCASSVVAPGRVQVHSLGSKLLLGEPRGGRGQRVGRIAALFGRGGLACAVVDEIRENVWRKLHVNLGSGPLSFLTETGLDKLFKEKVCGDALRSIFGEVASVAKAEGFDINEFADRHIEDNRKVKHLPSITQDLIAQRPVEIDAIYDAPLAIARMHGIETPTLDLLVTLVKLRATAAGIYG